MVAIASVWIAHQEEQCNKKYQTIVAIMVVYTVYNTGAYRPIRNIRKRLHINLQIFLGENPQPPPLICHPPPTFFTKNVTQ